jgi:hypothetical protein
VTKAPSPLLGYNNNVRHKNRMFHVQTEDSGVKHPHIITHLFMDGGRILKSVKKSYAEHVGSAGMADIVRTMMKEQHKAMLIALRDGQFDSLVDPKAKPPPPPEPAPEPPPAQRPSSQKPPSANASGAPRSEDAPATTRTPSTQELTLDIEALERAAKDTEGPAPIFPASDALPPPPQNLFRDKQVHGQYRAVTPAPPEPKRTSRPPPSQRPRKGSSPAPAAVRQSKSAPPARSEGRYAPARPAAIFGQSRAPHNPSLFGEDLISDKSLDEVILSYLAEDLEPSDKKKR